MDKIKKILVYIKENKKILRIAATILIIVVAVLFFSEKGENDTISIDQLENNSTTSSNEEDNNGSSDVKIYVDISGEVKTPGVYSVKTGSRIFEIIEKAGGLTSKANINDLNQAEIVSDGQKIIIASKDDLTIGQGTDTNNETNNINSSSSLININTADSSKLQEISGVGPATAEKIINYRNSNGKFKNKEDLKNVSGIGDKTYEKIKNDITV